MTPLNLSQAVLHDIGFLAQGPVRDGLIFCTVVAIVVLVLIVASDTLVGADR